MKGQVLSIGSPDCRHQHVLYTCQNFRSQVFQCEDCPRREYLPYNCDTAGEALELPADAYVCMQRKGANMLFYTHKADASGKVVGLARDKWVQRDEARNGKNLNNLL